MARNKSCELIEALEAEWRDALCSKDLDRLRTLVHPDFTLIGTRSSGPFMMHRDEWLDAIERRDVHDIDLVVRDATVLDHVMIGTVQAKWRLKYLNRVIEDCVLLTDVWVLDEGRWRALRRHSTPAPGGDWG
ncbi:nuclear transport factor 2 family protein [Sphingomonas lutea]|uniref:Nuclear transport factor 2 family protein n=1 Tax=Sphingomonas lutea TaxID=1045317 RepID=A0A7G9SJQ5_9SPHN|nr:nuclear transport factor 2 family protein [Sphingomonas lutea]QNN68080.1 nuclear transport factor 2 family protein [Sphingomonas lutea]